MRLRPPGGGVRVPTSPFAAWEGLCRIATPLIVMMERLAGRG